MNRKRLIFTASFTGKAVTFHFPLKSMEAKCVRKEGGMRSPVHMLPSSASQSVDGKGLHLNKGQSMTTQVRPEGHHV